MTTKLKLGPRVRTMPLRPQPPKRLYRFFVGMNGELGETLAIVEATNDDEAMEAGFKALGAEHEAAVKRDWPFAEYDEDDGDAPYFSVERLKDRLEEQGDDVEEQREDLEYVLGSSTLFKGLPEKVLSALALRLYTIVMEER